MNTLYITIEEAAEYLNLPKSYVEDLIQQKKVRALFDGERYLLNKEQFNTHLEQMEKYKQLVEEILNEPIPEDMDVKDED
ncbi:MULTISPECIES: helix-turn-helix domain-containing protein [Bacillus cereus group]|uniref:Helix-turn-helix domain-containing protein n=1 Tax=Bacillus proteolyticus TaxID=2026192 RepID=A0ABV3IM15_9BACI|nr:helix-turn-helix domain-containing protein [Bacillus cereus group sp. N8]MBJ8104859.1 helix-turn-helix domain-containing protein [Bacillus cereus group sp. N8]